MTAERTGDAGQAFPIYLTAVAGLLFLALAFFAVGKAGATHNSGQTAADAAALAAAQDYRQQLRTALLQTIDADGDWGDLLAGRGLGAGGACDHAQWFAARNDADVTHCRPAYLPTSFAVTVRTRHSVGNSVVPGGDRHATARATAEVAPRCSVDPPRDGDDSGGEPGDGHDGAHRDDSDGDHGDPGGDDGASDPPPAPVLHLVCDGDEVTIDPEDTGHPPDPEDLFAVRLTD